MVRRAVRAHEGDSVLDRALDEFPFEPLPRGFVLSTMLRVAAEGAAPAEARRKCHGTVGGVSGSLPSGAPNLPSFGTLDVLLPAMAAACAFVLVMLVSFAWSERDPVAAAALQSRVSLNWLLWTGRIGAWGQLRAIGVVGPVVLVCCITMWATAMGVLSARLSWLRRARQAGRLTALTDVSR